MNSSYYIAYYNGKYVPESDISISPNDRGFLYGDGVFETMRTVGRRVISYKAHYDRLLDGCQRSEIKLSTSLSDIRNIIDDLLIKNQLSDAYVRVTVTRGSGDQFGFGYSKNIKPTLLTVIRPSKIIPDSLYEKGVKIDFQFSSLFNSHEKIGKTKSLSAQPYVLAKQKALDKQCYDMILMDAFETVYEGTSSNIFIIKNGMLLTPPLEAGILAGTTRARVIEIVSQKLNIPVAQTTFSKSDVLQANEIFLTNTNIQVLPVTQAEMTIISDGKMGGQTENILHTFRQSLIEILE
ncbi:aminotransferase class IV [bacterium]|nr:aminotransferase class IV [bacterium]